MERFGGLLMLFGTLLLGMSAWRWVFDGPDVLATFLSGVFFLILGWFVAIRDFGPAKVQQAAADIVPEQLTPTLAKSAPSKAIISFVQTGDDDVLERVERLLEQDARITSITSEGGRWYSVPDGDDLPEWYALRAYCSTEEVEQIMADMSSLLVKNLGSASAAQISISRYS